MIKNRFLAVLRMHYLNFLTSMLWFWLILLAVFLLNLLFVIFFAPDNMNGPRMNFGSVMAVFLYMLISGFVTLKDSFGYTIGMSITRKEYYLATVLAFLAAAACNTLLTFLLHAAEKGINSLLQVNFYFFSSFYQLGHAALMLWIHFFIQVLLVTLSFVYSCYHYKYGKTALFTTLAGFLLVMMLFSVLDLWRSLFHLLGMFDSFGQFTLWCVPLVILLYIIGWFAVRKMNIRPAAG